MSVTVKEFNLELKQGNLRARTLSHDTKRDSSLPVIVFLHEGLGCIGMWHDFPEQLAETTGLNTLVFDRIGYGKSDSLESGDADHDYLNREPYLHLPEVLEFCNINSPLFIGHSDGGTIALRYSAKYPEAVAGIISIAAHTFVDDLTTQGIANALEVYQSNGLRAKLSKYHGNNTDFIFYRWANTWLSEKHRSWNMIDELESITCPVLAIQGLDDHYGTEAQVDSIVDGVSGYSEKVMIPGCGHVPHHEKREQTLSLIHQFISFRFVLQMAVSM